MFRGRADQRHRGPRRAARRAAGARGTRSIVVDGANVVPEVHAVLDRMADFADRVRVGRVDRRTPASGSATSSTSASAARDLGPAMAYEALRDFSDRSHDVPVRVERRRHRHRGGDPRPRPRRDAVHRLVEDVHDARDAHQRRHARAAWLVGGARRRGRGRAALRRGVDERRRRCAEFGIDTANMFEFWDWVGGRYSLRLGDRAVADDRDRAGALPRHARRLPRRWTSTSAPRRSTRTCRCCSASSASGTATSSAPRRTPSCRTASTSRSFRPTSSSSTWRATASRSTSTATPVDGRPARSCGARRARTASTPYYQLIHQGTKLIPCRLHRLRAARATPSAATTTC